MIRQQLASENPSFRSPLAYGYRYLGDICKRQGKVEEAEKYYALARETDPGVIE